MCIYPSALLALMPLLLSAITASTTGDTFSCRLEVPPRTSNKVFEGACNAADEIYIQSTPDAEHSAIVRCAVNLPRGGADDDIIGIGFSDTIKQSVEDDESQPTTMENTEYHEQDIYMNKTKNRNHIEGRIRWRKRSLPKRLLKVARNLVDRTATILLRSTTQQSNDHQYEVVDHSFDELDSIIENSTSTTADPESIGDGNNGRGALQKQILSGEEIDNVWLEETSWPPLPKAADLMKGWKLRSFRTWINKMELKFLSAETAKALGTIRNIIEAFPDYGVVDLFGMYNPKDVIWSIVALSRLQHILESDYNGDGGTNGSNNQHDNGNTTKIDKELLEELAHYCTFANAAYGWKGFAFNGIWRLGDNNRILARSTGINRRDIVTANWHSKANRPAYYIARNRERKAIVLGIRGSLSPRDILTDLCASSENFIVEDDPNNIIGSIEEENDSTISTTAPPPLIVGRAHKGMVDAARSVARMTGKTISDELDAHPDYSLVIVGHSLGGGVGACIAAMWKRRFHGRVRSIGYGNPCVFPLNLTKQFESEIISVMGTGDPFATISLGHIADATKALSTLCQDGGLRKEILKRTGVGLLMNPKNITRKDYDWCSNAMVFLRKQMDSEKLFPPGKIYQMSGQLLDFQKEAKSDDGAGGEKAMLKPIDAIKFNELKLHARMLDVSLHIPLRYDMILRRLVTAEADMARAVQ